MMRFYRLSYFIIFVMVASISVAMADDKFDQIEKEAIAKWQDVKSMTGKMEFQVDMQQKTAQGTMNMKNVMEATIEYLRKGEIFLSRFEGKMKINMNVDGRTQSMETPMLAVSDGNVTHTLVGVKDQQRCIKSPADPEMTGGTALYKILRDKNDIVVRPDEEMDGETYWVIEGTPKERKSPQEPAKMVYYLRQKDAVIVKIVGFNPDGEQFMVTTFKDLKFNEELDPSRFEFKVPEGVEVLDMTRQRTP